MAHVEGSAKSFLRAVKSAPQTKPRPMANQEWMRQQLRCDRLQCLK